ncbi:MAG: ABC transporter ATP-binding protein, partial [Planctomycetia bacterium]|nr:ABC transporter ATP-binding protein [Planctomycetia bacterium]
MIRETQTGASSELPSDSTPQSAATAVVCRGVTKTFGEGDARVQALRGVDLEVLKGQMTVLVGPSG